MVNLVNTPCKASKRRLANQIRPSDSRVSGHIPRVSGLLIGCSNACMEYPDIYLKSPDSFVSGLVFLVMLHMQISILLDFSYVELAVSEGTYEFRARVGNSRSPPPMNRAVAAMAPWQRHSRSW